jgi:ribosomal protein S12 methylthiotransferase accessory factor
VTAVLEPDQKVCLDGTHRIRRPEDTWRWIEPLFPRMGITRVADVTWLDEIGIPVYQAIRPDSWSLCVSQGKGLTADHARVSATMESIELWHGERMSPGERVGTPRQRAGELPYRVDELALTARSIVNLDSVLEWSPATALGSDAPSWVPTELVNMDCRAGRRWTAMRFYTSTNGLASGNTVTEAVLHGLYEVIERDALSVRDDDAPVRVVDPETVTGPAVALLEQLRRAGVVVLLKLYPSRTGLPCFGATIWSEALPITFHGHGCHIDRDVALCRAVTEAAQSRVTVISGARDDLPGRVYTDADGVNAGRRDRPDLAQLAGPDGGAAMLPYSEAPTTANPDLSSDLRQTVARVTAATGREPLFVDHTRPEVGIPVVHVVCPRFRFDPQHA